MLAPDWQPVVWTEEEQEGQAWGLKTVESFHLRHAADRGARRPTKLKWGRGHLLRTVATSSTNDARPPTDRTVMQTAISCTLMRGGTSKGAYFLAADLPADEAGATACCWR